MRRYIVRLGSTAADSMDWYSLRETGHNAWSSCHRNKVQEGMLASAIKTASSARKRRCTTRGSAANAEQQDARTASISLTPAKTSTGAERDSRWPQRGAARV